MGATSKVIMGGLLIMVVSLALILCLLLVLLAELYCSLLLGRKHRREPASTTTTTNATTGDTSTKPWKQEDHSAASSLSSFYTQGVLQPPRSFLFPELPNMGNNNVDMEKQQQHSHHPSQSFGSLAHHLRLAFSSPPPSPTPPFTLLTSPKLVGSGGHKEQVMYICNPVFDNGASRISRVETPFETPDSSPSRLDTVGSSEEEGDVDQATPSGPSSPPIIVTPQLTPMKKLPAKACSVPLRHAGSVGTSGSDQSNSNNRVISSSWSSSSSDSPRTSPSC